MTRKIRVLHVGESSLLPTGYGVMGDELLGRLHDSGEFEVCELASSAPRGFTRPWAYIPVLPDESKPEEVTHFNADKTNLHGAFFFEQACLEFRPDVVFAFRDIWVDRFIFDSPFRPFFHLVLMPTCDAENLASQWLDDMSRADAVLGYTNWAVDVMNQESGGRIPTRGFASPGVDTDVFCRLGSKVSGRESVGLPVDSLIVGMVARNGSRKLFPDLMESFAQFLSTGPESIRNKTYLYLHTGYPDSAWDIPSLLNRTGIGHRCLFTYACRACQAVYPSVFRDSVSVCKRCGAGEARLPEPNNGVAIDRSTLARIINLFDVAVQYSAAEGFGVPQIEAAACEVPVFAVDYSAMSEVVRNLGGTPIAVERFYTEAISGRKLALPNNADLVTNLSRFLILPETIRRKLGWQARNKAKLHYSWDGFAEKWAAQFRSAGPREQGKSWCSPQRKLPAPQQVPANLPSDAFVRRCITEIAGRPELANTYLAAQIARELGWGVTTVGDTRTKFTQNQVVDHCLHIREKFEHWETRRCAFAG